MLSNLPSDIQFDEADMAAVSAVPASRVQSWCNDRTEMYKRCIRALQVTQNSSNLELEGLPEEDSKVIAALNPSEVQPWCKSRIGHYKARVRALRSVYNAAALINRMLPPELLMEIFGNLHHDSSLYSGLRVMRVCRAWNILVKVTPQFWANLVRVPRDMTGASPGAVKRLEVALERSGALYVALDLRGLPDPVFDLVSRHIRRTSSFKIGTVSLDQANKLSNLFGAGLPRLRHLHFSLPMWTDDFAFIPRVDCLPNLFSLSMTRAWYQPQLFPPSLRRLTLSMCWCAPSSDDRTNTFDNLISALKHCPSLEDLQLKWCLPDGSAWNSDPEEGSGVATTVSFPALRRLYVEDHTRATCIILSRIIRPDSVETSLRLHNTREQLSNLRPVVPQLSTADTVHIELTSRTVDIETFRQGKSTVHVEGAPQALRPWVEDDAEWQPLHLAHARQVAALFASATPITTLTVREFAIPGEDARSTGASVAAVSTTAVQAWSELLRGFPRITCLEVPRNASLDVVARALELSFTPDLNSEPDDQGAELSPTTQDSSPYHELDLSYTENGLIAGGGGARPDLVVVRVTSKVTYN